MDPKKVTVQDVTSTVSLRMPENTIAKEETNTGSDSACSSDSFVTKVFKTVKSHFLSFFDLFSELSDSSSEDGDEEYIATRKDKRFLVKIEKSKLDSLYSNLADSASNGNSIISSASYNSSFSITDSSSGEENEEETDEVYERRNTKERETSGLYNSRMGKILNV